jgi:hypothetical protein
MNPIKPPNGFNIWTMALEPGLANDHTISAGVEALELAHAGYAIADVTGTAIPGTRSTALTFTRTAGTWNKRVKLPITALVATAGYPTFALGETVTESSSSHTGVVECVDSTSLTLRTISDSFHGSQTLTGGTSGVTATGGTPVHELEDLAGEGKLVWSHPSGTVTTGKWVRVNSNTATILTVNAALETTGTAVIIADDEQDALSRMTITYGA